MVWVVIRTSLHGQLRENNGVSVTGFYVLVKFRCVALFICNNSIELAEASPFFEPLRHGGARLHGEPRCNSVFSRISVVLFCFIELLTVQVCDTSKAI
jgi:hypothetical protein